MDQIGLQIAAFIVQFAQNQPIVLAILAGMGTFRLILKPLFTFLRSVVQSTATKKDDELLDKVERSQAYKTMVFVLDWLFSVKLIK